MSHPAPAVVVEGVSKSFSLPKERVNTFKERALHPFRRDEKDNFRALDDVSFSVGRGEFFGIVGRNGSGKSTLLKCMAGIYGTDSGRVLVDGRVSTFIELGVGFNPDLAARDNAVLNAIMLGLSKREAVARYDRIIDFAELREFEDLKLKNYSSGMLVRLAFSVMIQVDADILLIDEVLAVGDAGFQQKCFDEFNRLRDEKRTVLLVTHDMSSVQRFCDRALLIERGNVVLLDDAEKVAAKYYDLNFNQAVEAPAVEEVADSEPGRRGDRSAEILEAWLEDPLGERIGTVAQGDSCTVSARVRFHAGTQDPHFAATFSDGDRRRVFTASTVSDVRETGSFEAGETVTLRVCFDNWLAPGRYFVAIEVARRGDGHNVLDHREQLTSVVVSGTRPAGGLVDLPHELTIERTPHGAPVPTTTADPS